MINLIQSISRRRKSKPSTAITTPIPPPVVQQTITFSAATQIINANSSATHTVTLN